MFKKILLVIFVFSCQLCKSYLKSVSIDFDEVPNVYSRVCSKHLSLKNFLILFFRSIKLGNFVLFENIETLNFGLLTKGPTMVELRLI